MFSISDKVVCVDDSNLMPGRICPNGLVTKGQVYCIAGLRQSKWGLGLYIVGKPCLIDSGHDVGWKYTRFRKLDEVRAENVYRASFKPCDLEPQPLSPA